MTSDVRTSAISPQIKLERRVSLFFASFFYGFLALAGCVWLFTTKQSLLTLLSLRMPVAEIVLGLGTGVLMASACAGLVAVWSPARTLEREFGWILGGQRKYEIVVLALLSGFAEELFFRGAMTAAFTPLAATIVFGLLHWPVTRAFAIWPLFALAAGAIFALEAHVTRGLAAPMIAHATLNLLNLWRITGRYQEWKE